MQNLPHMEAYGMQTQDLGRDVTRRVGVLTSKGWRRTRRGLLVLTAVLCSGCGFMEVLEDFPVSQAIFYTSGTLAAVPVTLAAAPITVPLFMHSNGGCKDLALPFLPGIGVGCVVGGVVASPFLVCETLLHGLGNVFYGLRRPECFHPASNPCDHDSVCPYCGAPEGCCD